MISTAAQSKSEMTNIHGKDKDRRRYKMVNLTHQTEKTPVQAWHMSMATSSALIQPQAATSLCQMGKLCISATSVSNTTALDTTCQNTSRLFMIRRGNGESCVGSGRGTGT
jgi:hypothetical protein